MQASPEWEEYWGDVILRNNQRDGVKENENSPKMGNFPGVKERLYQLRD